MTASSQPLKPLRVLCIEDSEPDAELLIETLRRGGYKAEWQRVQSASEMEAALAEKAWELVLCDYSMPSFTALEALQVLKERGLDVPFIVVSGVISEEAAEVIECLKSGAHDFFLKSRLFRFIPAVERELQEAENRRSKRAIEQKLIEYTNRLEQSNKELEQFARVVSHHVQSPLRKVRFFSDYLQQSALDRLTDEERDSMARIQKAVHRMEIHIEALLNLSKVTRSGKPFKRTELSEIARAARADISEPKNRIEIGGMVSAEVDEDQIRTLLYHLMDNGIKFQENALPKVKVSASPLDEGYYEIAVQDNGIGVREENKARIFEPFHRFKGGDKDVGLGLTLCKKIAERHGGSISVESVVGVGSTFKVKLPYSPPLPSDDN
jgi:signal transduction histidine kinase